MPKFFPSAIATARRIAPTYLPRIAGLAAAATAAYGVYHLSDYPERKLGPVEEKKLFRTSHDFLSALVDESKLTSIGADPVLDSIGMGYTNIDWANAYGWFLVTNSEFAKERSTKKEYFLKALESARKSDDGHFMLLRVTILSNALAVFPDLLMDEVVAKEAKEAARLVTSGDPQFPATAMFTYNYANAIIRNIIATKRDTKTAEMLEEAKCLLDYINKHVEPPGFWTVFSTGVNRDFSVLKSYIQFDLIRYHLLKAELVSVESPYHFKQAIDISNVLVNSIASSDDTLAFARYYKGVALWGLNDKSPAMEEFSQSAQLFKAVDGSYASRDKSNGVSAVITALAKEMEYAASASVDSAIAQLR